MIGRYVRLEGLLTLEEAVHMMTQAPAERFKLRGKGVLATGMAADIVVFDRDLIEDAATYDDPLTPPRGVAPCAGERHLRGRDAAPTDVRGGRFIAALVVGSTERSVRGAAHVS